MNSINRREFIRNTSLAAAGLAFSTPAVAIKKYYPNLAFSTLGCPRWSFTEIVEAAVKYGYEGLEIRGIQRFMDITKSPEFNNTVNINNSMKILNDNHLRIVCLGASTSLHYAEPQIRKTNLDEAKNLIDLSQKVNCPYIRVFPDKIPKDQDRKTTMDLIMNGLTELGNFAKGSNVQVLLETHGDVVKADDLQFIMRNTAGPHVGLIWDVSNMWVVTKESPEDVYRKLKKYIRHTHFRDARIINGEEESVLLGRGEVPLKKAAKLLQDDNYKGFFSFEWEKRWISSVEDPEIAFPQFAEEIRKYF